MASVAISIDLSRPFYRPEDVYVQDNLVLKGESRKTFSKFLLKAFCGDVSEALRDTAVQLRRLSSCPHTRKAFMQLLSAQQKERFVKMIAAVSEPAQCCCSLCKEGHTGELLAIEDQAPTATMSTLTGGDTQSTELDSPDPANTGARSSGSLDGELGFLEDELSKILDNKDILRSMQVVTFSLYLCMSLWKSIYVSLEMSMSMSILSFLCLSHNVYVYICEKAPSFC